MKNAFTKILMSGLLFLFTLVITSCLFFDPDGCGNEVLQEIPSPDKNLKAVIFHRDCGATTDFSTQVSIIAIDKVLPNEAGNIFVCDSDHGKTPAGSGGGPPIEVRWKQDGVLEIVHDSDVRIIFAATNLDKIKIEYAKKDF